MERNKYFMVLYIEMYKKVKQEYVEYWHKSCIIYCYCNYNSLTTIIHFLYCDYRDRNIDLKGNESYGTSHPQAMEDTGSQHVEETSYI